MSIVSEIERTVAIIHRYGMSINSDKIVCYEVTPVQWDKEDWDFFQSHKSLFSALLIERFNTLSIERLLSDTERQDGYN